MNDAVLIALSLDHVVQTSKALQFVYTVLLALPE